MQDELIIPTVVARRSATLGDRVALQMWRDGRYFQLTYGELGRQVAALAGGLREIGVRTGDRVGVIGENRPEWPVADFAAQACGGIALPLDSLLKPPEIAGILADAGAKMVIASPKFLASVRTAPGVERAISMEGWDGVLGMGTPVSEPDEAAPDDVAAIIYTSGTTGRPKGVMLSHRNILTNARGAQRVIRLRSEDIFLSVLPLHHTFECTGGLICPVDAGATVTYARSMKSRDLLDDMRGTKATVMLGVPLLYEKLLAGILRGVSQKPLLVRGLFRGMMGFVKGARAGLGARAGRTVFRGLREKAGLGSLRLLISGGAPLPESIPQGFEDLGIAFVQGYGLTETSPVLTVNPAERPRHNSVGVPVPGVEVRIDGANPEGIGEIVARGDIIMRGYYNQPEMTGAVIREGWFHTGDLGRFDAEGYLHICGRSKNVIVTRGGKNVYPEEIETALNASPLVAESLVYGVAAPDGGGEEIAAIVVPEGERFEQMGTERGAAFSWEETEAAVRDAVKRINAGMADYKRIREVKVRAEELPKTSTRKVQRFAIPELQKLGGARAAKTT